MNKHTAHQHNLDAAQRELDQRNADGEDVSHLIVDARTAQIVARTPVVRHPLPSGAFAAWDNPCPRRGF